ncbi:MAG: hypothetical protein GY807_05370 [Gammaproteobacteria bacterium]|nr:hypothetical protein [Gammaproteobacteria bacterium]
MTDNDNIQPRRDEQGVPWCKDQPECMCFEPCDEPPFCSITKLEIFGEPICLPAVQQDHKRLAEAEVIRGDYSMLAAERDAFQSQNTQLRRELVKAEAVIEGLRVIIDDVYSMVTAAVDSGEAKGVYDVLHAALASLGEAAEAARKEGE